MYKKIIFSLCFISFISANSKILTDTSEVHTSQFCSSKLINQYLPDLDIEHDVRTSFVPSELLKKSCTNFNDSCCLDEEFQMMTDIAKKNLEQLFSGVKEARVAFKLLDKLTSKKIKELIESLTKDDLSDHDMTIEEIEEDLNYLKKEWKEISNDLSETYKMVEQFGGGMNCTLCEATNHSNFTELSNTVKIQLDYNYCYQLFNSQSFIATLDFVKNLKTLNTFSKILGNMYNVKVSNDFKNSAESANNVDKLRVSCLASTDDYSDDEQCAEMCLEIGKPNEFFFKEILYPLTSFVVMTTDYFGNQEILKSTQDQNSKDESQIDSEVSFTSASDMILAIYDQWNVKYILPPVDEENPINLNRMKVDLVYDKGWNFHEVRMKNWKIFTSGVEIMNVFFFALISLKLLF